MPTGFSVTRTDESENVFENLALVRMSYDMLLTDLVFVDSEYWALLLLVTQEQVNVFMDMSLARTQATQEIKDVHQAGDEGLNSARDSEIEDLRQAKDAAIAA